MKRKLLFGLLMAMLLVPWPVAYAYEGVPAAAAAYPVAVTPVDADLTPEISVYGGAYGSVGAGDLFYIDTSDTAFDVSFILFFTNTDDLAASYRSLTIEIVLYAQDAGGDWIEIADYGSLSCELFMTLRSGSVEFSLGGYRHYKVSVSRGGYYALPARAGKTFAVPEFYLSPTTL